MTGTFMPPKPDLVFHTPPSDENDHLAFYVQLSPTKPEQDLPSTSSAPIIEDWVSDSEEEDIPKVPKDVPSLAQSPELVKTPRHSGLISPPPMSVAPPIPLRPHSPSKGLKKPKKTCFVCKSETHLIKDCDFHARKLAQNSCAPRDIHKHNALIKYSRIPLHKVPTAAKTIGAARPPFYKARPHISPYTVSKSKAPISRPFIRHITPKPRLSPPRVNAANPSAVSAARVNTANPSAVSAARVKAGRLFAVNAARIDVVKSSAVPAIRHNHTKKGNPQQALKDKGVIDSGCSRHMTGNISYLSDFEELNGGYVAFGGNPKGGTITSKECDKKNNVLFTDTECLVLSSDFKLPDASQVLLSVPRENNMYNVNLKHIIPSGDLTCLFAKASLDESNLWLHMDLFGPTFVKSLSKKSYCLVVTDDYSRFSWVFFLATKDETASFLKTFIAGLENLLSLKVKIIRCDNGTEFKNADLNQFCGLKVNTACHVQNRVLVTKPHNKTPYELLHGRLPSIEFMRPFGCPVTILNTLDPLGKFQGKVDEGFLVGYSVSSKAFRVFNSRTRIVQETLHVNFMENKPNVVGSGLAWLFDIDSLSQTMNYHPVLTENQSNPTAGFQDTEKAREEGTHAYVLFLMLSDGSTNPKNNKDAHTGGNEHNDDIQKSVSPDNHSSSCGFRDLNEEFADCINNSSNVVSAAGPLVSAAGLYFTNSTNDFTTAGHLVSTAELNFINNTNDFSAAGPSNAAMLNLEDFSHNEDNVEEPKRIHQALKDPSWIEAMQEELIQSKMKKVWILVDLPYGKRAI
nr:hypothetical protein [Tanacetum cinerariifolium]